MRCSQRTDSRTIRAWQSTLVLVNRKAASDQKPNESVQLTLGGIWRRQGILADADLGAGALASVPPETPCETAEGDKKLPDPMCDTLSGEDDGAWHGDRQRRSKMTATLKMTHKAIGAEVRRARTTSWLTVGMPDRSR